MTGRLSARVVWLALASPLACSHKPELTSQFPLTASVILATQFARPDCSWAHAPYCVLRLRDDEPALYRFLERVIE